MKVEKKSNAFMLKVLATKVNCSICKTSHAKKSCKKTLQHNSCCDKDASVSKKCAAHCKQEASVLNCCWFEGTN
jgi:hypothetical protein